MVLLKGRTNRRSGTKPKAKGRRRRRYARIPTKFNPLPEMLRTKLRYTENFIFSTTTTASVQLMRGNSIYDPNYTGTGHQPLYRDQYSTLYNKYCVLRSSIYMECVCPYSNQSMQVVVYPQVDDTTTGSNIAIDSEKPRARSMIVSGGAPSRKMKHTASTGALYAQHLTARNKDDVYCSASSSNPLSSWYWIISSQNPDLSTSSAMVCAVTMIYDVVFFDKIRQSQS